MGAIARFSDVGVGQCCDASHDGCIAMVGIIVTSGQTMAVENNLVARIGDMVIGNCGHIGIIVTGSPTYILENNNAARIGDQFSGTFSGVIVTGANSMILDG